MEPLAWNITDYLSRESARGTPWKIVEVFGVLRMSRGMDNC